MKLIIVLHLLLILVVSCGARNQKQSSANKASKNTPAGITHTARPQGISEYDNIHSILRDKADNLWFATSWKGGIYRYDGKSFKHFTSKDGLCSNDISCIYEDKKGVLWLGTSNGVCRYKRNSFKHLPIASSDGSNTASNEHNAGADNNSQQVVCILEDRKGNVWFGTNEGVYHYDGKLFTPYIQNEGVTGQGDKPNNRINDIIEDKAGSIWMGSWSRGGAYRYDGKTFTQFTDKDGLTDDMIASILEDKKGNIWVGTRDHGVCYYDGKSFIDISKGQGLNRSCVYDILEDKNGNIWLATETEGTGEDLAGGVWRYDGKTFIQFTTKDGLVNNHVFSIAEDKSGNLWFGTRGGGLCRYDGKNFVDFSDRLYTP